MSRLLLVLLFLPAFLFPGPAAGEEKPDCELTLAAPKAKIALGERIEISARLVKKRGKPAEVNALRLARNSLSLRVTAGGATRTVTRIYGGNEQKEDGSVVVIDLPPPRAELKRGKPLEAPLPFIGLLPGENRVKAVYAGLGAEAAPVESEEVVITVEAAKEGARVGAVIETSEGPMAFVLWPEKAYNTVFNFLELASQARYDGLTFHRIVKGFMVQGGDPKGDGTGNPGYWIPGELDPALAHEPGIISMARSQAVDTAGSQFFVMHGRKPGLDGKYAAFGALVEGKETLELLASTEVVAQKGSGEVSKPVDPPVIKSVRVAVR